MQPGAASRWALAALFVGATAIGFAPIFVRWSETGPSATAFYRLLFALPLLWLWKGWEYRHHPTLPHPQTRKEFGLLTAAGLCFVADLALWHWSLRYASVANSTVITNLAPLFVAFGAWAFLRERISRALWIGLVLSLAGILLLAKTDSQLGSHVLLGDALAVMAALFYAAYLLLLKPLRQRFSTATIMAWSGLVACAGFFAVAVLSGDKLTPDSAKGWQAVVALALVSHIGGQVLIVFGFGHLPASFSSLTLLWQPVITALAGWWLLHEPLGVLQAVGGALVLSGIVFAGRART